MEHAHGTMPRSFIAGRDEYEEQRRAQRRTLTTIKAMKSMVYVDIKKWMRPD